MRGLITGGGKGTRFYPVTRGTNKHLLQVYDQAMIQKPITYLVNAGIKDILVVSSPHQLPYFGNVLESPEVKAQLQGARIHYARQENDVGGIADVIRQGETFATIRDKKGEVLYVDDLAVVLGDNVFYDEDFLRDAVKNFKSGAVAFVRKHLDDENLYEPDGSGKYHAKFGMIERDTNGKIARLYEKPPAKVTHGRFELDEGFSAREVLVGAYILGSNTRKTVFERIASLSPSGRGQLEITDLLRTYLQEDRLSIAQVTGYWYDCGGPENLQKVSDLEMAKRRAIETRRSPVAVWDEYSSLIRQRLTESMKK